MFDLMTIVYLMTMVVDTIGMVRNIGTNDQYKFLLISSLDEKAVFLPL
jgi:hypothetical protein